MSYIQQFFTSRTNQDQSVDNETGNLGTTFVGQEGRLWWDPDTNKIYVSDGSTPGGIPVSGGGGGNGTPGGANRSIQFNNSGSFGGTANLTYNSTTSNLSVVGNVVATAFYGNTLAANVVRTDNYQYANGQPFSGGGGGDYGNSNVASYLQSGTVTTPITTTSSLAGNVVKTDNYQYANGQPFSGGGSNYGNSNVATYLESGTVTTSIITTSSLAGNAITGGSLSVTGTVTGATVSSVGAVTSATVTATGNITGGNIHTAGQVSATGNITANVFFGNGSQLTGISSGLVLITSNITSLTAGYSLNIESIYGNSQYPGGIFNFYQAPQPRPTITLTDTWTSTTSTSKNAYANYAGNVVNSSSVTVNLGISTPATFAIQSSDDITIGTTVITGSNITGLGISGTGGTYTIASSLIGNVTQTDASSAVTANLSTSAGNSVGATGTTLTTVAPVPFSISSITANFANTTITPGLGNSQPVNYNVTVGSGTALTGNIIITGGASLITDVGNTLVGSTANIDSTAGDFVVTANYVGSGLFGAGNSVSSANVALDGVTESTPLFYKTTLTDSNPNFVPTDTNFGNNWVPAPGAPGNTYGITTDQYLPDTAYYWLAIPNSDFWGYSGNSPSGLYYNYALTGIGTVNSSFNAAYGNGTAEFGGAGGNVVIGTVSYVVLGFTGFANAITGPSNPANVFVYVSTSPTS